MLGEVGRRGAASGFTFGAAGERVVHEIISRDSAGGLLIELVNAEITTGLFGQYVISVGPFFTAFTNGPTNLTNVDLGIGPVWLNSR